MRHTILLLWLVAGCDGGSGGDAGALDDAGLDAGPTELDAGPPPPDVRSLPSLGAANSVEPTDPLFEGQQRFLLDAMGTERVSGFPPAAFFEAWLAEEPDLFDRYGFLDDPNDDFPVGLKRGLEDPTLVQSTCALCHVARLPDGRVWLGAPNTALQWSQFQLETEARWVAQGNPARLTPLEASKLAALGPGRIGAESASYEQVVPADFPPYLRLGTRSALNYLGTSGDLRSEVYLAVYTNGAANPNPRDALVPWPVAARLDPMIEAMGAFDPPVPPAGDASAISAGRAVYEREGCDGCHHVADPGALGVVTYDAIERRPGDDPEFPNGSIATSRLHRVLIEGDGAGGPDTGFRDLIMFITRNGLTTRLSDGYRAADLAGLWASAPFLHNGSVPTLDALLRPAVERPATFDREGFLVDTAVAGNSNQGHEFSTDLTEEDRAALVAYLMSQ